MGLFESITLVGILFLVAALVWRLPPRWKRRNPVSGDAEAPAEEKVPEDRDAVVRGKGVNGLGSSASAAPGVREHAQVGRSSGEPEVLAIRLYCKRFGMQMAGEKIWSLAEEYGLRFGDRNIFHYHDKESGEVQFSMLNGRDPGTFDLSTMHEMQARSLAVFLQLPGPRRAEVALQHMIDFAYRMQEEFSLESVVLEFRDEDNKLLPKGWEKDYRRSVKKFIEQG